MSRAKQKIDFGSFLKRNCVQTLYYCFTLHSLVKYTLSYFGFRKIQIIFYSNFFFCTSAMNQRFHHLNFCFLLPALQSTTKNVAKMLHFHKRRLTDQHTSMTIPYIRHQNPDINSVRQFEAYIATLTEEFRFKNVNASVCW